MKKQFVRQAKLPRGAYNKDLGDVIGVYRDNKNETWEDFIKRQGLKKNADK